MTIILLTTTDLGGPRRADFARLVASIAASASLGLRIRSLVLLQNCPLDKRALIASTMPACCRVFAVSNRMSLSAARNHLLDLMIAEEAPSCDDIVGFPDDDCWYPVSFHQRLSQVFASCGTLDLLVCRVSLEPDLDAFDARDVTPITTPQVVRLPNSNSMFLRASLVANVGRFDPTLGLGTPNGGGEDTDFVVRAYLLANAAGIIDRPLVGHPEPDRTTAAKYFRGALIVLARHGRQSPALLRELLRKVLVGLYFVVCGKLRVPTFWGALVEGARTFVASFSVAPSSGQLAAPPNTRTASDRRSTDPTSICVLYTLDNTYLKQAGVCLAAMLDSNPTSHFSVSIATFNRDVALSNAIFDLVLSRHKNCRLIFKDMDEALFSDLPVTQAFSKSIYTRLIFDRIIDAEFARVLYMDVDTLVREDLRPLWELDLDGATMAAVPDPFRLDLPSIGFERDEPYFNSGVLLIDRRAWRSKGYESRLLAFLGGPGRSLPWMDQDALNIVLRGDIKAIGLKWNFQPRCADVPAAFLHLSDGDYEALRARPGIIHYTTTFKPWNAAYRVHYSEAFFSAAKAARLPAALLPLHPKPSRFADHLMRVKTYLRWHYPQTFRFARKLLRPDEAALMYRAGPPPS